MRQLGVGHGKAFGVKIVLVQHPDKLVLRCHVGDIKGDRAGGVLLRHGGVTNLGRRTNSVCQDTNMIGGKRQSGRKCRRRNAEWLALELDARQIGHGIDVIRRLRHGKDQVFFRLVKALRGGQRGPQICLQCRIAGLRRDGTGQHVYGGSGVAVLDIGATQQVQGIYIAGFALYNLATSFDRQGEITLLERLQ